MGTARAVALIQNNWFTRDEPKPELTPAERRLIGAAVGPAPERWDGQPDVGRMHEILAAEPAVLARIGASLLTVVIGMRGCGPAVAFLPAPGVRLAIDQTAYNVLHEAAWAGAQLLIDDGTGDARAASTVRNKSGKTAFEIARKEAKRFRP